MTSDLKSLFAPFQRAARSFAPDQVRSALAALIAADAKMRLCYPFGDLIGADGFYQSCYAPLHRALPDLERRDMIVIAGRTPEGQDWLGCMGHYLGTFNVPFLGIPPNGQLVHIRYHEFYHFEDGKVVEMQGIWDIPELMMQAGAWPMAPQLGRFLCAPGPLTQDGLVADGEGQAAMTLVISMLTDLCRHPAEGGPKVMQLEKYWHPQCNWYGPAGIGTARGIAGFRHWHQIPFLRGMPDRKLDAMGDLMSHWIAAGEYVAETGWPNMRLTLSDDGWLGIPPLDKEILLRSLDFWRVEDGLIRENWVLVDLLDMYHQIGVDVFARMAEFNKARNMGALALERDY